MVPLALGTQTAGSVIRPAAYCGAIGFKPTRGLISRSGVLTQSSALDTVGTFSRTVEDAALLAECLAAFDPRDRDMWPRSGPRLHDVACQDPPMAPVFAYVSNPLGEEPDPIAGEALGELVGALGEQCDVFELPEIFSMAKVWHRQLQEADIARNYGPLAEKAPGQISAALMQRIAEGRAVLATDYNTARDFQDVLNDGLAEVFARYDAILTPAATGLPPRGLESTGDPIFCALWTYLGVPAISLPLLAVNGLPLGVQLVGPRRDDARLLRTARWLVERVTALGE
jgi:Asp-tRNA(Asn)/Glu-tRNA(Gln) amidotransferase A subunit family amidase